MTRANYEIQRAQELRQGSDPNETPSRQPSDLPFLFVDGVTAYGAINGTAHITLNAVSLSLTSNGQVQARTNDVANIRLSVAGAKSLQEALEKSLLAIMPVESGAKN